MHAVIENFLERPTSHKVAFWIGSLLLLGGLYWQYVYGPVAQEQQDLSDKKNTLNTQILNQKRIARNLPKFQEEVRVLEAQLQVALQELPDQKDIPNLLRSVADLAKEAGLDVSLFKPEPEVRRDFFAEVPVSMTVEGTYHQIASFFDEVGHLSRIVNIRGIAMHEPRSTERGLIVKADCVATTFRYLSEQEREAAAQGDQDKKRRRRG